MRNRRMASRLLALALTVLMLASCFVALPAMAEETTAEATTTGPKVLWEHNFADDGAVKNNSTTATDKTIRPNTATDATYPNGYFQDTDVFYMDASGTSATQLSSGYFTVGGVTYITGAQTTGEKPNNDFFSLLNGQYTGYKNVGDSVFFEFDFRRMYHGASMTTSTYGRVDPLFDSSCTWSYIDENGTTITSEDVASATLYTDHGGAAANGTDYTNSYVFFTYSNNQKAPMFFRMAENGMIYTTDNYGTAEDALAYGGVYYFNDDGEKVYLPATATVANLNLDGCIKDPTKAHTLEYAVNANTGAVLDYTYLYRVGVSLKVAAVDASTGMVTMDATVYIKRTSSTNTWDKCVGTTTYYYYPVDSTTSATEARNQLQINGTTGAVKWGGDCKISSCNGDYHVSVIETVDATDSTRITCKCAACGETWLEREVDGLRYRGVLKGNACEGTYYVWVPKDTTAVGVPFADSAYTTEPAGHTYNTSGKCTVCGEYEFITELPEGFLASAPVNNGSYPDFRSLYWDAENGEIKGQPSNPVLLLRDTRGTSFGAERKPLTVSFDFKLTSCTYNTTDGKSVLKNATSGAELLSIVPQKNGVTAGGTGVGVLAIGLSEDGKRPFISCYNDYTVSSISITLNSDWTENTSHSNYNKLTKAKACYNENEYYAIDNEEKMTRTYYFKRNYDAGIYYLTPNEWINVQCTIVPHSTKDANTMVLVYVNGNLVCMRPVALSWQTAFDGFRFGPGSLRYTVPSFRLDNVGLEFHDSLEDALVGVKASNQVISYGFDRYQSRITRTNSPFTSGFGFGSTIDGSYLCVGRFDDTLDDSLQLFNNGEYAYYDVDGSVGSSDRLQFCMTGLENGNNIEFISKYKYEVSATLAIDEGLTQGEGRFSGNHNMLRLSKFRDTYVALYLTQLGSNGYRAFVVTNPETGDGGWYSLVDEHGNALSPYTTVDEETGRPARFSTIRAVIDEKANTYSIFVDDITAYYEKDGTRYPFVDMQMPSPSGTGVTKALASGSTFTGNPYKYHDYTRDYFEELVDDYAFGPFLKDENGKTTTNPDYDKTATSYQYDCEYLCLFQTYENFYLKNVTVSIVPDSDIEMIGVQDQIDDNDNLALRFVAGIDDIYVPGVGYSVEAWHRVAQDDGEFGEWEREEKLQTINSAVAFSSIKETDKDGNVDKFYAYDCQEGAYLSTFKIIGIPRDHGANEQYKFTVTPYTLDADGKVDKTFEPYTAIYNGAGKYLGNGEPLPVDLSEFKDFTEAPKVLLELKDGSGDYADSYIYTRTSDPSGRYYIRYRLYYSHSESLGNCTNTASNIRSFRIMSADIVKVTAIGETSVAATQVMPILGSGEISLAIKEYRYGVTGYQTQKDEEGNVVYQTEKDEEGNEVTDAKGNPVYVMDDCPSPHKIPVYILDDEGNKIPETEGNVVKDFIGGFHGDEQIKKDENENDMFSLVMDGETYVPGQGNLVVAGNEIVIKQTTELYRWAYPARSLGTVAEHTQIFTINEDGINIDRTVKWLVDDFYIVDAYVMMLTLLRCTTTKVDGATVASGAICEKVATFKADGTQIGSYTFDLNNAPEDHGLNSKDTREIRFSSDTSGASAIAKFENKATSQGNFSRKINILYRTPLGGADNKLYVPMTASGKTNVSAEGSQSKFTVPSEGETWLLDTFFKIDYVNPNN